jgi:hypothetical protein
MEERVTNMTMLNEVCQDLRLEWPGNSQHRRGKGRYELDDATKVTPLSHGD